MEPTQATHTQANLAAIAAEVKALVQQGQIPTRIIKDHLFVPLRMEPDTLIVAVPDPGDLNKLDSIKHALRPTLSIEVLAEAATEKDIKRVLRSEFGIVIDTWNILLPDKPEAEKSAA